MRNQEICKFWANIGITAGLAVFFFGLTQYWNEMNGAWTNIGAGLSLVVIGFILAWKGGMFGKM